MDILLFTLGFFSGAVTVAGFGLAVVWFLILGECNAH